MIRNFFIVLVLLVPHVVFAEVYISEIAWMGSGESANYEWIELYSTESTSLEGWSLTALDGTPSIPLSGTINGAFILERGEESLPSIADLLYSGALENSGEILILSNGEGVEVDRVDGSSNWSLVGGDNTTKETAQKVSGVWKTAAPTPGVVSIVSEPPVSPENTSSVSSYIKPVFTLTVPSELSVIASNEIVFSAEAGDSSGARFDSAIISWNFGDGTTGQGSRIYHQYEYPGVYVVRVHAEYGREEISKRILVEVRNSQVVFTRIDAKAVRIENKDEKELDISRWRVVDGGNTFIFPDHTYILPGGSLMLSSIASNFLFTEEVRLMYSDGEEVLQQKVAGAEKKIQEKVVYVEKEQPLKEEKVEQILPAAAVLAPASQKEVSIWVYAWIVLVLLVGGTIVYIRRYG